MCTVCRRNLRSAGWNWGTRQISVDGTMFRSMEFCIDKICKNDAQTLQKLRIDKNLCKMTKRLRHFALAANFFKFPS